MRLLPGIKGLLHIFRALVGSKTEPAKVPAGPDAQPELGKVYKGKVKIIFEYGAIVNLLPGIDGLLHKAEISHEFVESVNDHLRIGQLIKVKVIGFNDRGSLLSINALESFAFEQPEIGKVYEGKVKDILEYGAFVSLLPGINGLLHKSEVAHEFVENVNDHLRIGQLIKVKMIKIDDLGRAVLSIRALDSSKLEQFEIGKVYEGKVKNILEYGAFVSLLPGIDGLLRKSDISNEFIANVGDHLQIGQQIKVKVIGFTDSNSVVLSIKELDRFERDLPELGNVYEGKVITILENGAYVLLLPGIKGMLRISDIAHEYTEKINDHLQLGQKIKVKVIGIDYRGRMRLSMKALNNSGPEPGRVYMGKVKSIRDDDALVQLQPGNDGLLHKSEISDENIEYVKHHLQIDQLIKIKVIGLHDRGHVRLSMKQFDHSEPKIGMVYEGEVDNILEYGAFVNLPTGRTGLLHKSEISDENIENVNDHLQIGQLVKVKVIKIDKRGKVSLSMTALDGSTHEPVEVQAEPDVQSELPALGMVYEGKVQAIREYGAFVRLLPGIVGMLHKSEIAHELVENVSDHLQIGQLIKVKVIGFNDYGSKLSMKVLDRSEHEPLKIGKVYEVNVEKILEYGAFVRLSPSRTHLLHKSEISDEKIDNVCDHLQIGQRIKVKVIGIDDRGRLSLSIKALDSSKHELTEEQPEPEAQPKQFEIGKVYEGYVEKILEYGAFVRLLPSRIHLLHKSEISDENIDNVNNHLQIDQRIKVKVIGIDDRGSMALSMRELDSSKHEPAVMGTEAEPEPEAKHAQSDLG